MSELSEKLDAVLANQVTILSNQDVIMDAIAALDIPEEPPAEPPSDPTYWVRVTRSPGANAFVEDGKNKSGFLILKMIEPRVQYQKDRVLAVTTANPIDVDSSYNYYRLANSPHYLRADHVELVKD